MILIVGSEGFIGKHLMRFYEDSDVIGCHTDKAKHSKSYIFINKLEPNFNEVFKNNKIDVCINAAGSKGVGFSIENPTLDYQLNVENTNCILNAIKEHAPKCKFINLSSAAVYGNPNILPIKESHDTLPISPYGKNKLKAERIVKDYYDKYNIETCSLRIFSVYGPGLKKQLLWDVYTKTYSADQNFITLFGTGNESRDYIYIDDLIRAIDLVIKKGNFKGSIYNIANGLETKISDITKLLVSGLNDKIQIKFNGQVKDGDPLNWCSNIDNLLSLGYKSEVSIDEGVKRYVQWLEKK